MTVTLDLWVPFVMVIIAAVAGASAGYIWGYNGRMRRYK